MEEKAFCPYCGNKVTPGAKFCRHCGKSLVSEQRVEYVPAPTPKEVISEETVEEAAVSEDKYTKESKTSTEPKEPNKTNEPKEQVTSFMKTAEEKAKQTGQAAKKQAQQLKSQYDQKDPETKRKIVRIGGGILIACVLIFGFMWYQGKDYRQAMSNGDTYFQRGEYGEAQNYYKQAHDEKPGDEKSLEMRDHARTLGDSWIGINDGWDGRSPIKVYNQLQSKLKSIEDDKLRLAYQDTIDAIENNRQYKLERQLE